MWGIKNYHRSRQPRREWASELEGAGAEGQHRATPTRAAAPEAPPSGDACRDASSAAARGTVSWRWCSGALLKYASSVVQSRRDCSIQPPIELSNSSIDCYQAVPGHCHLPPSGGNLRSLITTSSRNPGAGFAWLLCVSYAYTQTQAEHGSQIRIGHGERFLGSTAQIRPNHPPLTRGLLCCLPD